MVEGQGAEGGGHIGIAFDNRQLVCSKILRHGVRQPLAKGGGVFGGFHQGAVACHQGGNKGAGGEKQRIIPRRDNADHAQGLRQNAVACRPKPPIGGHFARTHPLFAVLEGVADA